jgi:murein DD-endopeptidase MepM/ murein hydrolase activator NlpD
MKGFASSLLFLGSLIGFSAPWGSGALRVKQKQAKPTLEGVIVDDAALPVDMLLTEPLGLTNLIERHVPAAVLAEIALYEDFAMLKEGSRLHFDYVEAQLRRIIVQKSDYERLRVELDPIPTVMLDTFPLDAKSLVMRFTKEDLFAQEPTPQLLDVLDAEPQLFGVIDNQVDIIKDLELEDNIEVLAVGRYRGEHLEYLESIISVRINQEETSSLLFKYTQEEDSVWYGEDLEPLSYPFLRTPTDYIIISSKYGVQRGHKKHKGIDFAADIGTPIYAAAAGVIADAGWGTGYGLRTKISHDHLGDYTTLYAHMSRSYVKTGDVVRQGQLIGLIGNTGRSTGPHLHFELQKGHRQINPIGRSVKDAFRPAPVENVILEEYRDSVDKVFVQATQTVVDVSDLLALQQSSL